MKNHKQTQKQQVVEAMRNEGGFATLRRLYELLDFSTWKTKTPEATVRRIVRHVLQGSSRFVGFAGEPRQSVSDL